MNPVDLLIETLDGIIKRYGVDPTGNENHEAWENAIINSVSYQCSESYDSLVTEWRLSDKITWDDHMRWVRYLEEMRNRADGK